MFKFRWFLAIGLNQINPILPFVSDLGIVIPGASFFTYSLCLGACLVLIFFINRYQITTILFNNQCSTSSELAIIKYQNYSFITGTVMMLAMIGVGSFRNNEIAFVQIWHNFFAFLLFFTFVFDMYFESCIATILSNNNNEKLTIRNILYYITAVDLILVIITILVSFLQYPDAFFDTETRLRWSNDEPGYVTHVLSCILEWILILLMCPYLLTYRTMFQEYRLHFFHTIQISATNESNGSSSIEDKIKTST